MKVILSISILYFMAFGNMAAKSKKTDPVIHTISKSRLLRMKTIFDLLKVTDKSVNYSKYLCRSFDLVVNIAGVEYTETSVGGEFNQKQKDLIEKAEVGSKIYIEKAGVLPPEKHNLSVLPDIALQLK